MSPPAGSVAAKPTEGQLRPRRRTAGDRRSQLVEIGLELLPTTPVQELTVDEVARRAGISRSLLFHYFSSKRDYYTAVTRAAGDRLWSHLVPPSGAPTGQLLPGMIDRYVGWVLTYREAHLSFVRGAAGGDPWVAEVYEDVRERLVTVVLSDQELPDDAARRQLVRAWFAFAEDLIEQWTREPTMRREELVTLLLDVFSRLTG